MHREIEWPPETIWCLGKCDVSKTTIAHFDKPDDTLAEAMKEFIEKSAYDLLEKRVKELELDERMASREVERQLKINNELRERVQKLEAALERSKEWLYTIETGIVRTNTYKAAGYDARQTARLAWFDIDQILKGEGES